MAVIGTVVSISGQASVIDSRGIKKLLQLGEVIQPGETIVTAPGAVVELELANGRRIDVTSEQTVKLTQELVDAMPPDTGDSAVDQATVQAVIQAIAEGRDINEVLEETAAGLAAGGTNSYGFSFVDLLRITEGVNGGSYQFDGTERAVPPIIPPGYQLGVDGTAVAAAIPPVVIPPVTPERPIISISGPATVNEAAGTVTYTVTLSVASSQTVTVMYNTDGERSAVPGFDYEPRTDTLKFPPNETTLTFTVPILNDTAIDGNNYFTVTLAAPTNATIGVGTATTEIIDNDARPTINIPDVNSAGPADGDFTVAETDGATPGTFTITAQAGIASISVAGVTVQPGNLNANPVTITTPGNGTLVLTGYDSTTGVVSYTYTPGLQNNPNGTPVLDSISITVTDTNNRTVTASLDANITDSVPVAVNDIGAAEQDVALTVAPVAGVLSNDSTAGDSKTVTGVSFGNTAGTVGNGLTGIYGTLTLDSTGGYTYLANQAAAKALPAGQTATEVFTYTVTDADGSTSSATLTLTITGTSNAPVAVADTNSINEGTTAAATSIVGNVTPGTPGQDSSVDTGSSFKVTGVVAGTSALASGNVDSPVNGTYGSVSIKEDGSYTYTLDNTRVATNSLAAGEVGTEVFSYTITDSSGKTATTTLTITVTGTNDAPVALADTATTPINQQLIAIPVLNNDTDPDTTDVLTVTNATLVNPAQGTVSVSNDGKTLNFNPAANFSGPVDISYTISDGHGGISTAILTVTVGNSTPATFNGADTGAVKEDQAVTAGNLNSNGKLIVNDVDAAQSSINTAIAPVASAGALGSLSIDAAGNWNYNVANAAVQYLAENQTKVETFTVQSVDGTTHDIVITITGINDAAVISGQVTGAVTEAGGINNAIAGTPTVSGTLTDTDVDNAANTFTAVNAATGSAGGYGTYTMTSGGVWNYTLNNSNATVQALNVGQTLTDSFTVTSIDGTPKVVTVTINGANDVPANVVPGAQSGPEDVPVIFSTGNGNALTVSDIDSPSLTSTLTVDHGTLSLGSMSGVTVTGNNSGSVTLSGSSAAINAALNGLSYQPTANYSGAATLNLNTSDGASNTTSNVAIALTAVADTPLLSVATATITDPASTLLAKSDGLSLAYYNAIATVDRTVASNINNFEAAVESATATSKSLATNVAVASATVDDAYRYTGYVYLQAGHAYAISGYRDDTLEVKIGGSSVYGVAHNVWGNFTASTYTPSVDGYYSLEINYYNGDGIGSLNLTMSDNAAAAVALNTSNYNLYSSSEVLTNSGVDLSNFTSINDGGYYQVGNHGASSLTLNSINTALVDTDGSETLALTVGAIPVGAILTDGTNFFTSTAGATSTTVTAWDTHNLFLLPGTSGTTGATLSITSISTEASDGSIASNTTNQLFSISDSAYQAGTDAADNLIGTVNNDVLLGGGGNDSISAGNGSDVLIGGSGNDNLLGGSGADILWGGKGNDTLTGGNGSLSDLVSDVFVWRLGDQGTAGTPAVDTITDFGTGSAASGGDVLNIKDLLIGESANANSLQNYLHFEVSGANTIVHISNTGGFSSDTHAINSAYTSAAETQQIVLTGVNVSALYSGATTDAAIITNLLNNNKLVTD